MKLNYALKRLMDARETRSRGALGALRFAALNDALRAPPTPAPGQAGEGLKP